MEILARALIANSAMAGAMSPFSLSAQSLIIKPGYCAVDYNTTMEAMFGWKRQRNGGQMCMSLCYFCGLASGDLAEGERGGICRCKRRRSECNVSRRA